MSLVDKILFLEFCGENVILESRGRQKQVLRKLTQVFMDTQLRDSQSNGEYLEKNPSICYSIWC